MRSILFVAHAAVAIWLMSVAFDSKQCHVKPTHIQDVDGRLYTHNVDSYVVGSWVHVVLTLTLVEWISASFALYFLDIPNMLDPTNDENLGLHSNVLLCTLWNIIFLIVLWMKHDVLFVPANNIFVYSLAVLAAIGVQNFMARAKPANMYNDPKKTDYQSVELRDTGFWNANLVQKEHLEFHDRSYIRHLDETSRGLVCRMCEEAIVMPLFFMALFAIVPGTVTWALQMVFVLYIFLNFNIIMQNFTETIYCSTLYFINTVVCCIACIVALYGPSFPLFFTGDSPVPVYVRAMVFLMVLMWIMFAVLWTFDYMFFYRYDMYDWLTLAFKLIYTIVIAVKVCEVC